MVARNGIFIASSFPCLSRSSKPENLCSVRSSSQLLPGPFSVQPGGLLLDNPELEAKFSVLNPKALGAYPKQPPISWPWRKSATELQERQDGPDILV
jgi:hypothetical protein